MQGIAIPYEDLPTDKTVTGILCFSEDAARVNPETPCIHCGRCLRSCPRNRMPNRIYDAYEHRDMETVQKENAGLCIGCNACSFICPARRPLAYRILHAKEELAAMRKEETSRE